jgi:hypothetical protein
MQDANEGEANECLSDRNDELFCPVQKGESDCRAKRAGEVFEKSARVEYGLKWWGSPVKALALGKQQTGLSTLSVL